MLSETSCVPVFMAASSVSGGRGGFRLGGCGILVGVVDERGVPLGGGEGGEAGVEFVGVGFEGVGVAGLEGGGEGYVEGADLAALVIDGELVGAGGKLELEVGVIGAENGVAAIELMAIDGLQEDEVGFADGGKGIGGGGFEAGETLGGTDVSAGGEEQDREQEQE